MDDEILVKCLANLGNISRLRIYKLLVKAGENGLNVGQIQQHLKIPASTLSHHLFKLSTLDLIIQEKNGRIITCKANFKMLKLVVSELQSQCCGGVSCF